MYMKRNLFFSCIALIGLLCTPGCKGPEEGNDDTVEALIKSISIKNSTYNGTVDNNAYTVTFDNVAAETDVNAIQFNAKLSLGAKLDQDTYDFTLNTSEDGKQLKQDVKVINGTKEQVYEVFINLSDPTSDPQLDKLVMKSRGGTEYTAQVVDGVLALGMPDEAEAILSSITLIPARATYQFTEMKDNVLTAANPGKLVIEFMGRKTEMEITFKSGPTPGVDFTQAIVHDFSVATGATPAYFAGENVRGSDFDGEYVLIVSRDDAATPTPRLLKTADLLANNASAPIMLNVEGVTGGTHVVSAGRLSHGHIYICNLTVGVSAAAPLKVYHYASPTAMPDVWSWDGVLSINGNDTTKYTGRLGDNMSINLDESGNGYAFFCKQEPGDKIYRFNVTNFTTFSDPYEISLEDVCSYYGYVNQVDPGKYLFTSTYVPFVRLMDANGTKLIDDVEFDFTEADARPNHGVDPRIINYNRGRYLMFTVANSQPMHYNFGPVLYIMDITDGVDNQAALVKLSEAINNSTEENPWEPTYGYFLDTEGKTTASACSAQCNAAEVDGKLVVYTAAVNAGFALIEFPKAQ